jgi:serine protease Do
MNRYPWILTGSLLAILCLMVACEPEPQTTLVVDAPQDVQVDGSAALENLDFRRVVADAKADVFPATVFVLVLQENNESGRKITQESSGSGVIISDTGEVVTNWHVIDKAVEVRCLLSDGTPMDAVVVGSDKDTDLALLQLTVPDDYVGPMPFAQIGDSDLLKEGDFVMAMGAPWGLSRSVSMGIISCRDRYLETRSEYSLWLQTDAAISPGNSGGPLVNTDGEVIGINTRGIMRGGDTGFAVPSQTVKLIVDQLREYEKVNWSWTGLRLDPLKNFSRNIYFEGDAGVIIADTDLSSPARRAGIKPKDRLLAINGQPVTAMFEEHLPAVRLQLAQLPKHEIATLTIERDGETLQFEITPREKGEVEGEELELPRWNMTLKEINQFDNEDLFFYREGGVFIFGTKYPGNAAKAGLRENDIIIKIGDQDIETLEDVQTAYDLAIENIDEEHKIKITVLRAGSRRGEILDFSKDYERD